MSYIGTMVVHLHEAYLRRDTEMFGKMDPYMVFHVDTNKVISRTCDDAGKYPKWDQKIAFRSNNTDVIKMQLFDEDFNGKDDLIGTGELCYHLNDQHSTFKPQNVTIQFYYKTQNAGEVKMTLNFYPDHKKQKNLQHLIQEQALAKEHQAKNTQKLQKSSNIDKLTQSNKRLQQKFTLLDQLEDQIENQNKLNKQIVEQIQDVVREQENSELRTEIINEQIGYNRTKSQIIDNQVQKFQNEKYSGVLTLKGFFFEFITGLDTSQSIQMSFTISNSASMQIYNLVAQKQNKKTIKWNQEYQIKVESGHSVMFQAFHTKQNRLIGIGNIPLLSIQKSIKKTIIGIYKQGVLQANLTSQIGFEQSHK